MPAAATLPAADAATDAAYAAMLRAAAPRKDATEAVFQC